MVAGHERKGVYVWQLAKCGRVNFEVSVGAQFEIPWHLKHEQLVTLWSTLKSTLSFSSSATARFFGFGIISSVEPQL